MEPLPELDWLPTPPPSPATPPSLSAVIRALMRDASLREEHKARRHAYEPVRGCPSCKFPCDVCDRPFDAGKLRVLSAGETRWEYCPDCSERAVEWIENVPEELRPLGVKVGTGAEWCIRHAMIPEDAVCASCFDVTGYDPWAEIRDEPKCGLLPRMRRFAEALYDERVRERRVKGKKARRVARAATLAYRPKVARDGDEAGDVKPREPERTFVIRSRPCQGQDTTELVGQGSSADPGLGQ